MHIAMLFKDKSVMWSGSRKSNLQTILHVYKIKKI